MGVELVRRRSARPSTRRASAGPARSNRWHADVVALPETDLLRIRLWARERVPKHLWDELKVEADIGDRHVDIVEVRPPWDGRGEPTRFPIARLRYRQSTGRWAIYWRGDPIFWG